MDQRSPKSSIVNGDWTSFFKICSDLMLRNLKEEEAAGDISGSLFLADVFYWGTPPLSPSYFFLYRIRWIDSLIHSYQCSSVPAFQPLKVQRFKHSKVQAFKHSNRLLICISFSLFCRFFESVRPTNSTTNRWKTRQRRGSPAKVIIICICIYRVSRKLNYETM